MTNLKCLAGLLALLLLMSCGEESTQSQLADEGAVHVDVDLPTDELEIVMVPTPVQVPTVLKQSKCDYHSDHILTDLLTNQPATSHQKAIHLGISIVDFSYASINQDHVLANKKLSECLDLMDELGIDVPKDQAFLDRIESNKNNVDSLSYLILLAFERSTDYFKNTDKEQLGISILSGTALESSLLMARELEMDRNSTFFSFFNQQKQYATGLQVIMQRYIDEKSMQKNIKIAQQLEEAFVSFENWAASGDTTVRFDTIKADLLSDILLIKESSLR